MIGLDKSTDKDEYEKTLQKERPSFLQKIQHKYSKLKGLAIGTEIKNLKSVQWKDPWTGVNKIGVVDISVINQQLFDFEWVLLCPVKGEER